jgi:ribosome-associated protein
MRIRSRTSKAKGHTTTNKGSRVGAKKSRPSSPNRASPAHSSGRDSTRKVKVRGGATPKVSRPPPSQKKVEASPRAMAIAHAGLDKKAEDVLVLDVRGLTSYADYFVLMTTESDRQAAAIADHVEQTLKAAGAEKVGMEGHSGGRWVLIDYGDVIAHVFSREARSFYDLEGLWADAVRIPVKG